MPMEPVIMEASSDRMVTEHILGDHHIELGGILYDLHGAVVHQHIGKLHIGVFFPKSVHHLFPETAGVQHIAFFHRAEFFVPLPCGFKTDAADALDLLFAVFQNVGGRIPFGFVLAEIDAADQFSYNDEINALFHNALL